ncbi:hypothetical protein CEXT_444591 [Caerostris extrusa]|uniref:Uncharacterized protein n=1 Tax=Caerostris extrusa TaxID=172846 RepID=A0AAV4W745_CAEEX|nr:hypothetical protein CEXT_444591 [Caerostris extrusa]
MVADVQSTSDVKRLIERRRNIILANTKIGFNNFDLNVAFMTWNNTVIRYTASTSTNSSKIKKKKDIKILLQTALYFTTASSYRDSVIDFALLRNFSCNTTIEVSDELNSDHLTVVVTSIFKLHSFRHISLQDH